MTTMTDTSNKVEFDVYFDAILEKDDKFHYISEDFVFTIDRIACYNESRLRQIIIQIAKASLKGRGKIVSVEIDKYTSDSVIINDTDDESSEFDPSKTRPVDDGASDEFDVNKTYPKVS